MSTDPTIASLQYISRDTLASAIKSSPSGTLPSNTAIIDVRDSDHIGGHIKGSTWVPSNELDFKAPELVRTLKDKEVVVFHCALSQQRGPAGALGYLRARKRMIDVSGEKKSVGMGEGDRAGEKEGEEKREQKVYVLRGGFTQWQDKYGEDKDLTEGYQKDLWELGQ